MIRVSNYLSLSKSLYSGNGLSSNCSMPLGFSMTACCVHPLKNKLLATFATSNANSKQQTKSKLNEHDFDRKHNGFLLYECKRQKYYVFQTCIVILLSGIWVQVLRQSEKKLLVAQESLLYMTILAIMQFRTSKTLKRLVLTKDTKVLRFTVYQFGGISDHTILVPVSNVRGVTTLLKANTIRIGSSDTKSKDRYFFAAKYVVNLPLFEQIVKNAMKASKPL